jgi:sulfate transport system ATP-binding protein
VALLGPSGSGKTTLLRIIAGLEHADAGAVLFNGVDASPRHVRERSVGFVFQHYALFRHMTVFENVAFGFRVKPRSERPARAEIHERVRALLSLVQIEPLADRYPSQLSGGQRQRVALARALAIEPRVLLLDEPFGALDAKVRKELRRWLRKLHDRMKLTSVFVTHDQEEALELADRVVVMNKGRIEQAGAPEEVYDHPRTPFVYEFLGNVNRLACTVQGGRAELWDSDFEVTGANGSGDGHGVAYVRPHDVEILTGRSRLAQPAVVRHVSTAGPAACVELAVEGATGPVEAQLSRERQRRLGLKPGQTVFVAARKARVFMNPGPA